MGGFPVLRGLVPGHVEAPARVLRSRHPRRGRRGRRLVLVCDADGHFFRDAAAAPVLDLHPHRVGAVLLVPVCRLPRRRRCRSLGDSGRSRPYLPGAAVDGERAAHHGLRDYTPTWSSCRRTRSQRCRHPGLDERVLRHTGVCPPDISILRSWEANDRGRNVGALVGLQRDHASTTALVPSSFFARTCTE